MNLVPPVRGPDIPQSSQDVLFNPRDGDSTVDWVTLELTSVVTVHVSARIRLYLRACDCRRNGIHPNPHSEGGFERSL